jgi:hypothetical protein
MFNQKVCHLILDTPNLPKALRSGKDVNKEKSRIVSAPPLGTNSPAFLSFESIYFAHNDYRVLLW